VTYAWTGESLFSLGHRKRSRTVPIQADVRWGAQEVCEEACRRIQGGIPSQLPKIQTLMSAVEEEMKSGQS